jgi:hypothetical protein
MLSPLWSDLNSIWHRLKARHSECKVAQGVGAAKAPSVMLLFLREPPGVLPGGLKGFVGDQR